MSAPISDPLLLQHFTVLAYPFQHPITARHRSARLQDLEQHWQPWWARLSDHDLAAALDATSFFLPYARALLYPETLHLDALPTGTHHQHWGEVVRQWLSGGLSAYARELPAESVLRLTYRAESLRPLHSLTLTDPQTGAAVQGWLDWVDALLLPHGLGFLLLKVRLAEAQPRLGELIRLNQGLRQVHSSVLGDPLPALSCPACPAVRQVAELFDHLLEDLTRPAAGTAAARAPSRRYTASRAGRGYGERCHFLSYACVHPSAAEQRALPRGVFPSARERLLFEYACCIAPEQAVHGAHWVPAVEQVKRLRRENRLGPWRCWRALVLKDACVFLGTEDIPFNRSGLPRTIESCYLPLYVFALLQKYQMLAFADDMLHHVAQHVWEGGAVQSVVRRVRKLQAARLLHGRFTAFRSRYWFSEVTHKPLGGDLYRRMQQGLEVPGLYQMLTTNIKDIRDYLEGQQAKRWGMLSFALSLTPVAAATGAIGHYLARPEHWLGTGLLLTLAAAAVTALASLWWAGRKEGHGPARANVSPPRLSPEPTGDPRARAA